MLTLQNFGIHRNAQVNIPRGVTLIKGPNGAGKSTILDAIYNTLVETSTATKTSLVRKYAGTPTSCVLSTALTGDFGHASMQAKITVAKKTGKLTVGRGTWAINIEMGNTDLFTSMYLRQFCLADTSMLGTYFRSLIRDSQAYDTNKVRLDEAISALSSEMRLHKSMIDRMITDIDDRYDYTPFEDISLGDITKMRENRLKIDGFQVQVQQYENFLADEKIRALINTLPQPLTPAQERTYANYYAAEQSMKGVPLLEKPKKEIPAGWTPTMKVPDSVFRPDFLKMVDHEKLCRSLARVTKCPCCGKPGTVLAEKVVHHADVDLTVLQRPRPFKGLNSAQLDTLVETHNRMKSYGITSQADMTAMVALAEEHRKYERQMELRATLKHKPAGYENFHSAKSAVAERNRLRGLLKMPAVTSMSKPVAAVDGDSAYTIDHLNNAEKWLKVREYRKKYEVMSAKMATLQEARTKSESAASTCMKLIVEAYNERIAQIMASFHVPLKVELEVSDDGGYDVVDQNGVSWRMLSGGQQMMVSIALTIALSMDTAFPFILIDESLSCISEAVKEHIIQSFKDFCPHKHVLVVDHDGVDGMYDNCIVLG